MKFKATMYREKREYLYHAVNNELFLSKINKEE